MVNQQNDQRLGKINELIEAIMERNFTKRQMLILLLIGRATYGCGKKAGIFKPSDFQSVGVYPNAAMPELKGMARARVIRINQIDLGTEREQYYEIGFNENYGQWVISFTKVGGVDEVRAIIGRNDQPTPVTERKPMPAEPAEAKHGEEKKKVASDKAESFFTREPDLAKKLTNQEADIIRLYEAFIKASPFTKLDLYDLKMLLKISFPGQIRTAIQAFFRNHFDAFSSKGFSYIVPQVQNGYFGHRSQMKKKTATPGSSTKGQYRKIYA